MRFIVLFGFVVVFGMFTWQIMLIAVHTGRIADRLGEIEEHLRTLVNRSA